MAARPPEYEGSATPDEEQRPRSSGAGKERMQFGTSKKAAPKKAAPENEGRKLTVRFLNAADFATDDYDLIIVPYDEKGIHPLLANRHPFNDEQTLNNIIRATNKFEAPYANLEKLALENTSTRPDPGWITGPFKQALRDTPRPVIYSTDSDDQLERLLFGPSPIKVLDCRALSTFDPMIQIERLSALLGAASSAGDLILDLIMPSYGQETWEQAVRSFLENRQNTPDFDEVEIAPPAQQRQQQGTTQTAATTAPADRETRPHFLADHATAEDLLGYYPYAAAIAAFVRDSRTRLPLTIAIDGAWGTGKSSLMKMLRNELDPMRPAEGGIRPHRGWWHSIRASAGRALRGIWGWGRSFFPRRANIPAKDGERRFVTVFVNAWRHGKGTQLKANIVGQVLEDLAARFGPDFVLRLELNRLSRLGLMRAAIKSILTNGVTLALLMVATLTLVLALWVDGLPAILPGGLSSITRNFLSRDLGSFMKDQKEISSVAVILGNALLFAWKGRSAPKLDDYLQAPDYLKLAGDDTQVERDFARILETLHQMDCHLALFVDDLDRCTPTDCAAVVEALNTFFGADKNECLFVLGMHREMVATSLEVAYEKLAGKIEGNDLLAEQRPFGRRFLEKIVQFFITLPEPGPEDTKRFLDALTADTTRGSLSDIKKLEAAMAREEDQAPSSKPTLLKKMVPPVIQIMRSMYGNFATDLIVDTSETIIKKLQARGIDVKNAVAEAEKLTKLKDRIEERKNANENAYLAVFAQVRPVLRANPRQYKRFFNKLRFYRLMGAGRESRIELDAAEAALALEHPELHYRIVKTTCGLVQFFEQAAGAEVPGAVQAILEDGKNRSILDPLEDMMKRPNGAA